MKLISILLFLVLGACAHKPAPHTYLKYSGYMDGCADTATQFLFLFRPELKKTGINPAYLDHTCMEMYILKLESEDIKLPMKRFNRNEMI